MRAVAALLMLCAAAPAFGQEATASVDIPASALAAAEVHEQYCADTRGNDISVFGAALAQVSGALVEVSAAYESSHAPSLLYWRALLALCVGRDDVGAGDLNSFLTATEGDNAYSQQRRDASRRLRRLMVAQGTSTAGPKPGGIVAGVGLAAGAGAMAGLSGWQASELRITTDNLRQGRLQQDEIDAALVEGPQQAQRSNALLGVASALGVGSLVAFVVTAATHGGRGRQASWGGASPVVAAVPLDGGVYLSAGLRW